VFDGLGNVCQRMDGLGNVLSSSFYDGYGQGVGLVSGEPFGYGGQWGYYTDGEIGLTLLGLRYYDGGSGRFLTRDPWFEVSDNLYRYTENNPVNLHDPTGLKPEKRTPPEFRPGCGGDNVGYDPTYPSPCPPGFHKVCVTCYGGYGHQNPELNGGGPIAFPSNPHCNQKCHGKYRDRFPRKGDCAISATWGPPWDCLPGSRVTIEAASAIGGKHRQWHCTVCDTGGMSQNQIDIYIPVRNDKECNNYWKTGFYCVKCTLGR
jgi:RHS repeat-associated protein